MDELDVARLIFFSYFCNRNKKKVARIFAPSNNSSYICSVVEGPRQTHLGSVSLFRICESRQLTWIKRKGKGATLG